MEMARSWNALDVSAPTQDLKYMLTSNVNVSNFVSVKLSGCSNYDIWKAQMLCLIQSQELLHIIQEEVCLTKKYDILVKGWIFGSLNQNVLKDFIKFESAREVWMELESSFDPPISDEQVLGFKFGVELLRDPPETQNAESNNRRRERLYEAAVEGCWWKAKSILKIHQDAANEPITTNCNTILHLAVEMGHNYFVEKLLEFLRDGNEIGTKNGKGRTALHIASRVGNKYAAQLLVQKRKELLKIQDINGNSPLDCNTYCWKPDTYAYLVKSALSSDLISYPSTSSSSSSSSSSSPPSTSSSKQDAASSIDDVIYLAISSKQYDLAWTCLEKHPQAARNNIELFFVIAYSFPTDIGYMESFIYPSFRSVRQKTFERGSLLFQYNFWDKCVEDIFWIVRICNNTCCSSLGNISMILVVPVATLYPIYQLSSLLIVVLHLTFSMLYFFLWKVLAVTVPAIKNIEKTRKEYNAANKILRSVCHNMDIFTIEVVHLTFLRNYVCLEAAALDAYEVVDEILYMEPNAINWNNEKGHNIIQLAITNRSEKVYNLIHHIIEHTESYRTITDISRNNLAHLAGRLAPSSVLGRTIGAALQLQRELIWREEVEKLVSLDQLMYKNVDKETPAMVFTREHADLLKEGENWMKTTAESCSITAALIVTIVFAAAITVPGGSNQESGIPLFKNETAFTVFAAFNAFSLFTAATSLLLFLSILTARFSEKDFRLSLPRRLILGLLTLFLSTTAMIVAFGAILFLVFCDHRPWMMAPICGFACMPIVVIVTVKVPLLVDLVRSTYIPIFGDQSYLDSCKTNGKNTIFTD